MFLAGFVERRDPILKERPFGLIPAEGNHGEDLKEYYFYLDSTPTHSYMKYLYKYPQAEYPYAWLVEENARRRGAGPEFELLDTGVFDQDRYFDVFVQYAKPSPHDICIRIEAFNRGPDAAVLDLVPQLWFRNIWAWGNERGREPSIRRGDDTKTSVCLIADDSDADGLGNLPIPYRLGPRRLYGEPDCSTLFTDNESNLARLYGPAADDGRRFSKDAFHRHIVNGEKRDQSRPDRNKAGLRFTRRIEAGSSTVVRLRLTATALVDPLADIDSTVAAAASEADAFYAAIHPPRATADECRCSGRLSPG